MGVPDAVILTGTRAVWGSRSAIVSLMAFKSAASPSGYSRLNGVPSMNTFWIKSRSTFGGIEAESIDLKQRAGVNGDLIIVNGQDDQDGAVRVKRSPARLAPGCASV